MAEVIHPEEKLIQVEVGELLPRVMRMKKDGMRLSQACAAYIDEKFELSYSFADDVTYQYTTLRLVIDTDTKVPSITEVIPSAVFYENEMKELFGVKIQMISVDYQDKLYRIKVQQPLGPDVEDAPSESQSSLVAEDAPSEGKVPAEETVAGKEKEEGGQADG